MPEDEFNYWFNPREAREPDGHFFSCTGPTLSLNASYSLLCKFGLERNARFIGMTSRGCFLLAVWVVGLVCVVTPAMAERDCAWVWAIPTESATRRALADECAQLNVDSVSEVARFAQNVVSSVPTRTEADWKARAFLAVFGTATNNTSDWSSDWSAHWWESFVTTPALQRNLGIRTGAHPLERLFGCGNFVAWATGREPRDKPDPAAFFYVTVRVQPNDQVYWKSDDAAQYVLIDARPMAAVQRSGERFVAVRRGSRGNVMVIPEASTLRLLYPVDEATPVINTLSRRLRVRVFARLQGAQTASLNGFPLKIEVKEDGPQVDQSFFIREDDPPVLVVLNAKDQIVSNTEITSSRRFDFTAPSTDVGLLPISLVGCHTYGIDENQIQQRITSQLGAWGFKRKELGTLVGLARDYVDTANGAGEADAPAPRLQGSRDTAAQLQTSSHNLFAQGFRSLLSVRLTCSRTPANEDVFAVSATRVSLKDVDFESRDNGPELSSTTRAVKGLERLNGATSSALATLWQKEALQLDESPTRIAVLDHFRARLVLNDAVSDARARRVRLSLQAVPAGSDVCDRIRAWNELKSEARFDAELPRNAPHAIGKSNTNEVPVDYTVSGPGQYLLQASIPEPADHRDRAALSGRQVFACFQAERPHWLLGASYFFPGATKSYTRADSRFQQVSYEWRVRGFFGPPNGFGAAFGVSGATRRGVGPTSWYQAGGLTQSAVNGEISYLVQTTSLYAGLSIAQRLDLLRHWSFNLHGFGMLRFDRVDTSGVPKELSSFAPDGNKLGVDFTFGGTADITAQITREFAVHGALLLECPRTSALFFSTGPSSSAVTAYYDPNLFAGSLGIGGSYAWNY